MERRPQQISEVEHLTPTQVDLIVIGGGINGAGIARDAALRGLTVCVIEKNTCGSGASSKSSKLAHGGLRYLEHFEFRMVQEALKERDLLLKIAPKYVKPLRFLYPVYKFSKRPFWQIKVGMWAYSMLSRSSILPGYQILTPEQVHTMCPALKMGQLLGGAAYYDGQLLDLDMVTANIKDARDHGATILENSEVIGFIKEENTIKGVEVKTGTAQKVINAKAVINTSGAWSNSISALDQVNSPPLVAPTKGVHIVVEDLGLTDALILETPQDHRIFFFIPWESKTLIGTTDTAYKGSPDEVKVEDEDITYLLNAANYYLEGKELTKADITETFAGLRPLQYSEKGASKRSRDYSLFQSNSGLVHLFGGKYTSYRHMAEVAVNYLVDTKSFQKPLLPCQTEERPLE